MAQRFKDAFANMAKQVNKAAASGGGGGGSGGGGGRAAAAAAQSVTALAVAGGLAYGTYNSIYTVPGGHRAVMFNRVTGMKDAVYGEGLNFNIPWFERPIIYDIRTRPVNLQTLTGSKDLQMVTIAVRVLHKPNPNKLVWIYQTLGMNYDERILPSVMNESAKAIVARYNANELLTKRDLVSRAISDDLQRRASQFNIVLDDVAITHLSFSPEYARAVEAKQVGTFHKMVESGENGKRRKKLSSGGACNVRDNFSCLPLESTFLSSFNSFCFIQRQFISNKYFFLMYHMTHL
jgi:prohibitin 2